MSNEQPRILAINPGSRYVGFAAFRGPELVDWGVRVNRGTTSRGRTKVAKAILIEAMERFQPDVLAVKQLHPSRTSSNLTGFSDSITELARRRKIRLCQHSIGQLKAALCPLETTGNKRQLAKAVTALYPILTHDFQTEMANRYAYHVRMFEAVALGIVCYRHVEE
jgi:Holliday junction resolvasome RuvABC endonuclease subunit